MATNAVAALSGAGTVVAAAGFVLAWRERPDPGATALAFFFTTVGWWTCWNGVGTFVVGSESQAAVRLVEMLGIAFVPGLWLWFVLGAVGSRWYGHTLTWLVPSGVALLTVSLAATNPLHGLMWTAVSLQTVSGFRTVDVSFGPGMELFVGYAVVVVAAATAVLAAHARESYGSARTEVVLASAGAVPVVVATPYILDVVQVDPSPVGGLVTGLFGLVAVRRGYLDGGSMTRAQARDAGVEGLDKGFVVVDVTERVVDANAAAARILGDEGDDLVGRHVREVLLAFDRLVESETGREAVRLRVDGEDRWYEADAVAVVDDLDRPDGLVLILSDVTEARIDTQRLSVLNRVLRHDIRTSANVIAGYADRFRTVDEGAVETIVARTEDLVSAAESARRFDEQFCRGQSGVDRPQSAGTVVTDAFAESIAADSAVDVTSDVPPDATCDGRSTAVVTELLDNAVRHGAPPVRVAVSATDDEVRFRVTDDGDGIPAAERAAVESGDETPLEHASGSGLWTVVWGAERLGGGATFENTAEDGAMATLRVPRLDGAG